ncbi:MAG: hypothetical protein JNM69_35615 [Archangium sp.]|nr:hypothetical protein [Archangium sp.]
MLPRLLIALLSSAPQPFWGSKAVIDSQGNPVVSCNLSGACNRRGVPIRRTVVLTAGPTKMIVGLAVDRSVQVVEVERSNSRVTETSCREVLPSSLFRIGSGGHRRSNGKWEYLDSCAGTYVELFFDNTGTRRDSLPLHLPERYGSIGEFANGEPLPEEPLSKIETLTRLQLDRGPEFSLISSGIYRLRDGDLFLYSHFPDPDSVTERPWPESAGKVRLAYGLTPRGELLAGSGCDDELPSEGSDIRDLRRLPTAVDLDAHRLEFLDLCRSGVTHETLVTFTLRDEHLIRISERRVSRRAK